jgi:hypothetical protein
MARSRLAVGALGVVLAACEGRTRPQDLAAHIKGPDGKEYLLLDRGAYKGIYDPWGRLQRIEYDANGDGRPDHVAYHDGAKSPHRLDVDENFDGSFDRWEDYDTQGRLTKVGLSRKRKGAPDLWVTAGPGDLPAKKEYDDDGDMRVDRTEVYERGLIVRVILDSDHDGKPDRWQDWSSGRLGTEDIDTDADGQPDRRIFYNQNGRVLKVDPLRGP